MACQDPNRIHIGKFALTGAHTDGGEAFHQFDIVVSLLMRVLEVCQVDIFVEVDKVVFPGVGKNRVGMTGGGAWWVTQASSGTPGWPR